MPDPSSRPKRLTTISKLGRFFGHHEKEEKKPSGAPTSSGSNSTSPSVANSANTSSASLYEKGRLLEKQDRLKPVAESSGPLSGLSALGNQSTPFAPLTTAILSPTPSGQTSGTVSAPQRARLRLVSRSQPQSHPESRRSSIKKCTPKPDKFGGRLRIFEDGSHEHVLRLAKRQEKLSTLVKNMLGAKKLRNESVLAVSNILPPLLVSGLISKVHRDENGNLELVLEGQKRAARRNVPSAEAATLEAIDPRSFAEKYGLCDEVIGRGAFGVVKISHKKVDDKERLFAVKEFRKRAHELDKDYANRLAQEFCILSSLENVHIIRTLDLLKDARGDYCEVMEYCSGGDLYTLIVSAGKLEYIEADCFFKQLVRGIAYMHKVGVAHRDIKPENLLLTADGNLKITDFGVSEVFSIAWEEKIHLFLGVIGLAPYIAPELYSEKKYDLRPVDVWACGVVYMAMRTGRQLWRSANSEEDEFYQEYLRGRKDANGYPPIESLKRARCRNVIYSILDPVASRRITAKQILNSEWGREIRCCEAGEGRTQEHYEHKQASQ